MKLKASLFILFFVFLASSAAHAQVDRRVGREQYKPTKRKQEKVDFVEESVKYLTKELKLDDFQEAAVKSVIEDERTTIKVINEAQGLSADEKKAKAREISTRIYKKVMPLLTPEQAEKYTKMEEAKKF
jgi:Spy/CpxP family protein refolding chaperone